MKNVLLVGLIVFIVNCSYSQEALKPQPSPTAIASMKYKDAYVKITYSRPHKRGRKIFGGLVPYGKVWRTGANEATEITTTSDLLIDADTLHAGTYSIFTIPFEDHWTVIFNNELGQWGAYNYLEKSDEFRIEVPTEKITNTIWEPFTIKFEQQNEKAFLIMMWDRTKLEIPLEFIDDH